MPEFTHFDINWRHESERILRSIITNDDESAYRDAAKSFNNSGNDVVDEVDNMFESLFPYDESGRPSATWVFRFVRSENYGK
jgi:hypothetical protein